MKLKGVCVYCTAPAMYTCNLCGALVCEKHYDPQSGACIMCRQGRKLGDTETLLKK